MEYDSDRGENRRSVKRAQCNQSVSSQDSSHVEIADETASMSYAKKKSKQKGGVNTEVSPSIPLDVSVTGQELVLASAVDKKEGEASSSGLSESGKVSEQCDKTFSPSNADLMSVLCKMNSKLDSLNSAVNELTGTVFELKNEK